MSSTTLPPRPLRRVQSVPAPVRSPAALLTPQESIASETESPASQTLSPLFEFDYEGDSDEDFPIDPPPEIPHGRPPAVNVRRSYSDIQKFEKIINENDTPFNKVLTLCRPTTDICSKLAQQVVALKPHCLDEAGNINVHLLGARLIECGYNILVWNARSHQKNVRNALRNLNHSFLVCLGTKQGGTEVKLPSPLIVEPAFKEQFSYSLATDEYDTLVKAVPSCFVGPCAKLEVIVNLLAEEMAKDFERRNHPLPPWRTAKAMLSKWVPTKVHQLTAALVLQQSPDHPCLGSPTVRSSPAKQASRDSGNTQPDTSRVKQGEGPRSCDSSHALTPFASMSADPFGDDSSDAGDQSSDTAKAAVRRQAAGMSPKAGPSNAQQRKPISLLAQAFTQVAANAATSQQQPPPVNSSAASLLPAAAGTSAAVRSDAHCTINVVRWGAKLP